MKRDSEKPTAASSENEGDIDWIDVRVVSDGDESRASRVLAQSGDDGPSFVSEAPPTRAATVDAPAKGQRWVLDRNCEPHASDVTFRVATPSPSVESGPE